MEQLSSKQYLEMELLRFTTAGSVDDGKSTLIGRLLYDTKSIFEDQYEAVVDASQRRGEPQVNLALLTDGLRAEREQGITIDVAYRYFHTPKRKFIIADTPGHIQYTRNMVTGASTANLAIVLIDARKGVIEQTKRHSFIASLLKIPHLVVCVNKMDLINYEQNKYESIVNDFLGFSTKLEISDIKFIPISALNGDNVVEKSKNMNWYQGYTLLETLETVHISSDHNLVACRFPVQNIIRPYNDEFHDFRGYAGRVVGGVFKPGDKIKILPSAYNSTIKSIETMDGELNEAFPPMSCVIRLDDEFDISRGDMIVKEDNQPEITQDIEIIVNWMNEKPLQINAKYFVKHTSNECKCIVKEILYKVDINTLDSIYDFDKVCLNDIARIKIKTTKPLLIDNYKTNRYTGSLIIIDESTNETVGAGMVV